MFRGASKTEKQGLFWNNYVAWWVAVTAMYPKRCVDDYTRTYALEHALLGVDEIGLAGLRQARC